MNVFLSGWLLTCTNITQCPIILSTIFFDVCAGFYSLLEAELSEVDTSLLSTLGVSKEQEVSKQMSTRQRMRKLCVLAAGIAVKDASLRTEWQGILIM